jgi:hypothetical protein
MDKIERIGELLNSLSPENQLSWYRQLDEFIFQEMMPSWSDEVLEADIEFLEALKSQEKD